jgi:thiamine biosynthesis lipoprotein
MATFLSNLQKPTRTIKQPTSSRLLLFIALASLMLSSCKGDITKPRQEDQESYNKIRGKTMGTTYTIVYKPYSKSISQTTIDSILISINQSVSTYIDTSTISKINHSNVYGKSTEILVNGESRTQDKIELPSDMHFEHNYKVANRIYLDTDGYFDPTVMPLVNYWGFGYTPKEPVTKIDSQKINSILKTIGMEKITTESVAGSLICVKPTETELDFSAIAKGYAVDYISTYLKEKGVENLMVEIGGETYAEGLSPRSKKWIIGLNTPTIDSGLTDFSSYLELQGMAVASSGNYRIYYEVEGRRYGHEINPKTGYPERNALLGVSVIAPTCMEADAIATALMVMGQKKAKAYVESKPHIEAVLFVGNKEGGIGLIRSEGFANYEAKLTALVEAN